MQRKDGTVRGWRWEPVCGSEIPGKKKHQDKRENESSDRSLPVI